MRSITLAASLLLLTGCAGALKPEQAERVTPSTAYSSGETVLNVTRTALNVVGNALAVLVIAKWENQFDAKQAVAYESEMKKLASAS